VDADAHTNGPATAYPFLCETRNGHILLTTGQGERRRAVLRFHPDWISARRRKSDPKDWSTFESFGPAQGYWRDRRVGSHVAWNFPALRRGALRVECQGEAELALSDHFRDPAEREGGCVRLHISGPSTVEWDESGLVKPHRIAYERAPLHGISYVRLHPRSGGQFQLTRVTLH
jgi:hypothetical protein